MLEIVLSLQAAGSLNEPVPLKPRTRSDDSSGPTDATDTVAAWHTGGFEWTDLANVDELDEWTEESDGSFALERAMP